jgi:hypothetical protein
MPLVPPFFQVRIAFAPLPKPLLDALDGIEVETSVGSASILRLRFRLSRNLLGDWDPPIADIFRPLVPISVAVSAGLPIPETVVNGFVREVRQSGGGAQRGTTAEVVAMDASATIMNLIEQPLPHPNLDPVTIATTILGRYAIAPFPLPTAPTRTILDTTTIQRGTDARMLREMARQLAYEFYLQPDPLAGLDIGHFHPPLTTVPPQGVLSVDFGTATNLIEFDVGYDTLQPNAALSVGVDPNTGAPLPVPALAPLQPPEGLEPALLRIAPPPIRRPTARDAANPAELFRQNQAIVDRSSRAITGSGSVDSVKYGRMLRPGLPVAIRGAGRAHSGTWYVESVSHSISTGAWTQRFRASRNALGLTGAELFIDPLAAAVA